MDSPLAGDLEAPTSAGNSTLKVFVDTDIGVDDAVAIAYLLKCRSAEVIGFSTVAGNNVTTPQTPNRAAASASEHAAQNLLTLLGVMQLTKPVAIGAAEPLEVTPSRTGTLVHGPDGLWFAQAQHDLSGLSRDAPAAIAAAARAHPGMTLVALGPLTNIAQAVQRYPAELQGITIVALAGTRGPGNSSPVSEFNAHYDPHALDIVLKSGLSITLITLDAFSTVTFDSAQFPQRLAQQGGALGQFLSAPVGAYMNAQSQGAGGPVAIPDVTAVAYALNPALGTATAALVDVSLDGLTRGQTVIGLTMGNRVTMIGGDSELSAIADQVFSTPGFDLYQAIGLILARRPDNAQVVLEVSHDAIASHVEETLLR